MTTSRSSVLLLAWVLVAPVLAGATGTGEPDSSSYADLLPPVTRRYDPVVESGRYDELLDAYGRNKELPEGYELQALLALSHYPELREVRIRFVQADVGIPISSRPRPDTVIFRSRMKRLYLVVIDTEAPPERDALLLKNQPFNAQVGILGHELAHTAWYIHRSFFGIAADALCQLSRTCRVEFERATDRRLVAHRLGWQRYDHSRFVRSRLEARRVRDKGDDANSDDGEGGPYMEPDEILAVMRQSSLYALE